MPAPPSLHLPRTRDALGTPDAATILKQELESHPATALPLQSLLRQTAHALDAFSVTVLSITETATGARIRIGVFFHGVNPGCNCADDPAPLTEIPEYGELLLELDRKTAQASIHIPSEA